MIKKCWYKFAKLIKITILIICDLSLLLISMTNIFHHIKRHANNAASHVRKHHKKYLLWIFGGFAVTKMVIVFAAGVGVLQYSYNTFANQETGCTMTGQVYVDDVTTCTTIPAYLTGGTEECTITQAGYYTGGTMNDSGEMVGQEYVNPVETCIWIGQTTVEQVQDCTTISWYRTGGELICPTTGDESILTTGTNDTGAQLRSMIAVSTGVCDSSDISRVEPVSGAFVKWTIPFSWSYANDDCTRTGHVQLLTLQLYDHNKQRIPLATVSSLATGYDFDSLLLSWYRNTSWLVTSGIYTVANASGVVLYTGIASWAYTNFATGYLVRLLDDGGDVLSTGNIFTIDNARPTLTGVVLASSDAVSGVVGLDDQLTLTFTANESLSGLTVLIWGTGATLDDQNGLTYTYTQTLDSGFTQGVIVYSITYADLAGNTGLVSGTGLTLDTTAPTVSFMTLTGSMTSGWKLSFVTSELARFAINYARSGATATTYTWTDYATGNEYAFTGIQANAWYTFRLQIKDVVNNTVTYSGSFTVSSTGVLNFVYVIYSGTVTTGTLAVLTNVLKEEINKFNTCKSGLEYTGIALNINKNVYILHMPEFNKDYVKKVVNAFSLLILDKVEKNKKLTKTEVTEITDKFDNFLIVLKLIRDDDNVCKQNLSNYHISQFKRALDEYGIYFK